MNHALLLAVIESNGLKKAYIASKLGLSPQGLQNKLSGASEFRLSEIRKLRQLLRLDDKSMEDIFFAADVTDNHAS